jgi:hypothetical protein
MKVFISSVTTGMEGYRDAAARGIRALGHEVLRAEDYGASYESPQRKCLAGVRDSDAVVLLLGERYGEPQGSGMSPTHEEYEEAKERKPVLAFVQRGIQPKDRQREFIEEIRGWSSGGYVEGFSTEDELQGHVTRSLHEHQLSLAAGRADEEEMTSRAEALLPPERSLYASYGPSLRIIVVGGPGQTLLGAAELEDPMLERDLKREALFGDPPVFDDSRGTTSRQEGRALVLEQERASLLVDEQGSVCVTQPADEENTGGYSSRSMVLIEEELQELVARSLRFAGKILDRVDSRGRLSDVLVVAHLSGAGAKGWRTREEQLQNPSGAVTIGMPGGREAVQVRLDPAVRRRAALSHDVEKMAKEITVRFRRRMRP